MIVILCLISGVKYFVCICKYIADCDKHHFFILQTVNLGTQTFGSVEYKHLNKIISSIAFMQSFFFKFTLFTYLHLTYFFNFTYFFIYLI